MQQTPTATEEQKQEEEEEAPGGGRSRQRGRSAAPRRRRRGGHDDLMEKWKSCLLPVLHSMICLFGAHTLHQSPLSLAPPLTTISALPPDLVEEFFGIDFVQRQTRVSATPRRRRSVYDLFDELGPTYTRRAYRMERNSFFELHRLLFPFLNFQLMRYRNGGSEEEEANIPLQRNGARNGRVPSTSRLSIAIRYFAGGSVYDIALTHGVSVMEVYKSIWMIVDAVNNCPDLQLRQHCPGRPDHRLQ